MVVLRVKEPESRRESCRGDDCDGRFAEGADLGASSIRGNLFVPPSLDAFDMSDRLSSRLRVVFLTMGPSRWVFSHPSPSFEIFDRTPLTPPPGHPNTQPGRPPDHIPHARRQRTLDPGLVIRALVRV
jgi:hypothetical protein